MKPARFVLSLVGVALFLAIFTVVVVSAVAEASGTQLVNWGTKAGGLLGAVLLAAVVVRGALLWADNRRQKR